MATKFVSGGQTGADQEGIEAAAELGYPTGGIMPKGFRTEDGPRPTWAKKYGLTESQSPDYSIRTWENVKNSDVTVWFGSTSSKGYKCTRDAAFYYSLPFEINPSQAEFKEIVDNHNIVNIAGNRLSKNPGIRRLVRYAFEGLK